MCGARSGRCATSAATRPSELLRYGGNLQLINLVVVINVQADKPVLFAAGGSLRYVAY